MFMLMFILSPFSQLVLILCFKINKLCQLLQTEKISMLKKLSFEQRFVKQLSVFRDLVFFNFLGGPHILPLRYVINFFKGMTGLWVLFLMFHFRSFSLGMWVYLFLHGSYGIAWVWKDIYFPDATFKQKGTIGSLILLFIFLTLYWFIPVPLAAGYGVHNPPFERIILVIAMYLFGLYLMLGSDHQKNTTLAKQKGLISTGFFKTTRNPNYLGQVLIYGSFAICAGNFYSYLIFFCGSCLLFSINIYLKEKLSYEKKQGWDEYKKQSYILFPKLFPTLMINLLFHGIVLLAITYIARMGNTRQISGERITVEQSL